MKKMTRALICMLLILMIPMAACAEEYRVFFERETEPFGENEKLLTLRIAGKYGGD